MGARSRAHKPLHIQAFTHAHTLTRKPHMDRRTDMDARTQWCGADADEHAKHIHANRRLTIISSDAHALIHKVNTHTQYTNTVCQQSERLCEG